MKEIKPFGYIPEMSCNYSCLSFLYSVVEGVDVFCFVLGFILFMALTVRPGGAITGKWKNECVYAMEMQSIQLEDAVLLWCFCLGPLCLSLTFFHVFMHLLPRWKWLIRRMIIKITFYAVSFHVNMLPLCFWVTSICFFTRTWHIFIPCVNEDVVPFALLGYTPDPGSVGSLLFV